MRTEARQRVRGTSSPRGGFGLAGGAPPPPAPMCRLLTAILQKAGGAGTANLALGRLVAVAGGRDVRRVPLALADHRVTAVRTGLRPRRSTGKGKPHDR